MVTIEDQLRCQKETQSKLQSIEQILIGIDGTNGMRSELREAKRDIEELQKWKTQAVTIFLLIQAVGMPLIIAFMLKFFKL